jgi:Mrp family chromosome partitioning ATPase
MTDAAPDLAQGQEAQLPFEPRTILVGVWKARWLIVAWTTLSMVLGIGAGLALGSRIYQADTVLRYRGTPRAGVVLPSDTSTFIFGAIQFAKVRANMEEVRRRLELPAAVETVSRAVDLQAVKGSSILTISARWETPEMAAAVANAMRDVFMDDQLGVRLRDDLARVNVLEQEARTSLAAIETQVPALEKEIEDLKAKLEEEQASSPQEVDPQRALQLVQLKIAQEQQRKQAELALNEAEANYLRDENLFGLKLISRDQLERSRRVYERAKAAVEDSPEVRRLKAEMERLQNQTLATGGNRSPTASLLDAMQRRLIESKMTQLAAQEKFTQATAERRRIEAMLTELTEGGSEAASGLPEGWRLAESEYRVVTPAQVPIMPVDSNRKIFALAIAGLCSLMGLGVSLGRELLDTTIRSGAEMSLRLGMPSLAVLPDLPQNTRILPTVTDPAVVEIFGVLARRIRAAAPDPGARILVLSAVHGEGCSAVATNLAAVLGRQEGRVLLVDAAVRSPLETRAIAGEGRIAAWLPGRRKRIAAGNPGTEVSVPGGASSGRRQAAAGSVAPRHEVRHLMSANQEGDMLVEILGLESDSPRFLGLGAFLSSDELEFDSVAWPTVLPGVYCIPRMEEAVEPDMLASHRMRQLMVEASARFPMVILDGPPILPYADAVALTQWVDGVVLVVQSRHCKAAALKTAIQRISATRIPIIGAVLNRTDRLYIGI